MYDVTLHSESILQLGTDNTANRGDSDKISTEGTTEGGVMKIQTQQSNAPV